MTVPGLHGTYRDVSRMSIARHVHKACHVRRCILISARLCEWRISWACDVAYVCVESEFSTISLLYKNSEFCRLLFNMFTGN